MPAMSKQYGTFPASSSSSTPPAEGSSSTALDSSTSTADDTPSEPDPAALRRPWRELADPGALSVPRGFSDAGRRARINLARFAANYGQVYVAVCTACLIWWRPMYLFMIIACFSISPGNVFRFLLMFTPFLLVVTRAAAGVLVLLAAGLLLIAAHAVLHPTDGVDEEAGMCEKPEHALVS
ncbi:unnamed protein product [Urochloa humidicola]